MKLLMFITLIFTANILAQEMSHEVLNHLPFEEAVMRFEQNATDGDVEVVFELKAGDDGLTSLNISSPEGKIIGEFIAPDLSTLGIRQFRFESPEPKDIVGLKAAYPEGIYTFSATSTNGVEFYSEASLSHSLPEVTSFINPEAEAENVEYNNLVIQWASVENVDGYILELEQEDSGIKLQITLPGSVNMFSLPNKLMQPDTEYVLAIGTVSEEGNMSVVETSFTTSKN